MPVMHIREVRMRMVGRRMLVRLDMAGARSDRLVMRVVVVLVTGAVVMRIAVHPVSVSRKVPLPVVAAWRRSSSVWRYRKCAATHCVICIWREGIRGHDRRSSASGCAAGCGRFVTVKKHG